MNFNFRPMLLSESQKPFDSKDYLYELKYDGMRVLIFVSKTTFKIQSRNQRDVTYLFPELHKIQKMIKNDVIFDGEIVSFQDGVPDFFALQKRIHLKNERSIFLKSISDPVVFVAFDILYLDKELFTLPLIERKQFLEKYKNTEEFVKSFYIFEKGIAFFENIKKMGLEGMVAKEIHSAYFVNERTENWIKIKNLKEDTFWIGGYTEKKNTPFFSILLGEFCNDGFHYVGRVSVPKKNVFYLYIQKTKRVKSPFDDFDGEDILFCKPTCQCLVRYLMRGKNGILRQPVFEKFLDGK